jgi:hypothetical protein
LALTSPTSGGRSVGIVHWRTKAPEFFIIIIIIIGKNLRLGRVVPTLMKAIMNKGMEEKERQIKRRDFQANKR